MGQLAVECECGRALPVPADGRGPLVCSCGKRVVVPPPEEFQGRSVVLSAATAERRLRRLLAAGELPPMGACTACGLWDNLRVVDLWLDCERSRVRTSGGSGFLVIPLPYFLYIRWWEEEQRVEFVGRDTALPTPLCFCPHCAQELPCLRGADLAAVAAVIALGALVGYFAWVAGLVVGLVGLAAVLWRRGRRWVRWQRGLKALIRKVPMYGQMLDEYPFARVVVPAGGPADESRP
jgi:hypothetical protein